MNLLFVTFNTTQGALGIMREHLTYWKISSGKGETQRFPSE